MSNIEWIKQTGTFSLRSRKTYDSLADVEVDAAAGVEPIRGCGTSRQCPPHAQYTPARPA